MTETERIYAKAGANAEEISVAAGRAKGLEYDGKKELEAYEYGITQRKNGKGKDLELLIDATEFLDEFEDSGIMEREDIIIGRSVGAKAGNYDVKDLETGEIFKFVEGTRLQDVEVFAGKGVKKVFEKAEKYAERYGGKIESWQHAKGFGIIETDEGERKVEVHWVQCEGIGKYEFFIKEWLD